MNEVAEYLKSCGTFFLATSEDGQPHVRPFGAVCVFEGRLYIVTNNQKKVYRQMKENGKIENLRHVSGHMDPCGRRGQGGPAAGSACRDDGGQRCRTEQHVHGR